MIFDIKHGATARAFWDGVAQKSPLDDEHSGGPLRREGGREGGREGEEEGEKRVN